jgi:histone arginine demethylase JMJD6
MVERRSNLSPDEFRREYLEPLRPVVLTDGIESWGARAWTPEWFRRVHGDKIVKIDDQPRRLGDYIDQLLSATPDRPVPYLRNVDIPTAFPELLPDVQRFRLAEPSRIGSKLLPANFPQANHFLDLFIGGPGSGFPYIHYDIHHLLSYLTQIHGEKEFYLYPPEQGRFLYPRPDQPNESGLGNPLQPDLERFPLFREAKPLTFVLRPGETLFIPCGWWHATRMLSVSITLGFDQLCAANWRPFIGDQFARRRERPLKASAMLLYLMAAGAALSVWERATHRSRAPLDLGFLSQLRDAMKFEL